MPDHTGDNDNETQFNAARYRELARSLRVLASTASGEQAHNAFLQLAEQYEALADDEKVKNNTPPNRTN